MKNLLIIDAEQYGYHTDIYKYCQYLNEYAITIICYDVGLDRVTSDNVKVVYIKELKNKTLNKIRFFFTCLFYVYKGFDFVFVCFFPHCEFLKLFSHKKLHLDIRSMCVSQDVYWRDDFDRKLKKSIKYFDTISAISAGVALRLDLKKYYLLPLGADIISKTKKDFSTIRLLYVGVLSNRHIYETVEGIHLFLEKHKEVKIIYNIIGFGKEENLIKDMINRYKLNDAIIMHGRIPYDKLLQYFEKANIGVSYIPMTDYYDYQPPTKTFEYILSGLYCIATATSANKDIISKENGMLIQDNPKAFADALGYILLNKVHFKSEKIVSSLKKYQWKEIVANYLIPIIENESNNQ